jgi:threonine/homoserine/homoserine lactone efflux protein
MLIYLIQGVTFGFAAVVQPGPFQTYLMSQALNHGWRRTLPAALAPLISDGPIIILALLVLSQMPLWLEQVLQIAGGLFLFYLAYGTFRTWREFKAADMDPTHSNAMGVLKAAMVNMLNPNPYLSWMLVLGPLLVKGWRESSGHGIALMLGFYGTMIFGSAGIILLSSSARNFGPRLNRGLLGVSALGLALFGLFQLWQGTIARWWIGSV